MSVPPVIARPSMLVFLALPFIVSFLTSDNFVEKVQTLAWIEAVQQPPFIVLALLSMARSPDGDLDVLELYRPGKCNGAASTERLFENLLAWSQMQTLQTTL